jgi:hypothetical protein
MADDSSVPFWWILLFVLLTLGAGAGAVLFVGGQLVSVAVGIGGSVGIGTGGIGTGAVGTGAVEVAAVGVAAVGAGVAFPA